jgi:hypothetical protein
MVLSMAAADAFASAAVGPILSIGSAQALQNGFFTSVV